ncbi:MAG: carboxypeptidase-like regulatory domain-containing protein, partial [Flammeovirgaceae bacterium]
MINIYKQKRRSLWCMGLVFLLAFSTLHAQAQEVVVAGKVTDAETQQGLPGVSIRIDGTTLGTITDAEGNFKFSAEVTSGNYSLIASFIGYKTSKNALVVDNQTSYQFTIALA